MLKPELVPMPHTRTRVYPTRLLAHGFDYVPAAKTDITQTWRKAGWTPIERKAPNDIQANPSDTP